MPLLQSAQTLATLGRLARTLEFSGSAEPVTDSDVLAQVQSLLEEEAGELDGLSGVRLQGDTFTGEAIQQLSNTQSQTYEFRIGPEGMDYRLIDADAAAQFAEDGWTEIVEYAAKSGKKLNCKPGNVQCGGKCQSGKLNCFAGMTPAQKKAAQKAAAAAKAAQKTPAPTPSVATSAPAPSPALGSPSAAAIKLNQSELDKSRADLVQRLGAKTVEQAEKNVQRILDDADVFIRIRSASTLEQILGDRFKTAHELGRTQHDIPDLRDDYLTARARVEAKTLGYDAKATAPGDRPIYGYLAGQDMNGAAHKDVQGWGSIAVKLKPEVKARSTFTGADSFKSGIASEAQNAGPPPPPNAASLVATTRHGYDRTNLPRHYPSYHKDDTQDDGMLRAAGRAKTIDDLVPKLAPTGRAYMEAQVHGRVTPSDIAEIRFTPRGLNDRPTPAIAQFAKDNGVDLFVNDRKVNPDDYLTSAATTPRRIDQLRSSLETALQTGDFSQVAPLVEDLKSRADARSDGGDRIGRQIIEDAGFDVPMKIGTNADVTQAWKDGGTLLIRGMSTSSQVTGAQKFQDLKSGNYYVASTNIYGVGIYCSHASAGAKRARTTADLTSYNLATADADAKDAWTSLTKRTTYITSKTTNARMVVDRDAALLMQADAQNEYSRVRTAIKDWEKREHRRINNAARASKPMPLAKARAQVEAELRQDYDLDQPKQQADGVTTWKVTLPGRQGPDLDTGFEIDEDSFASMFGGNRRYSLTDPDGQGVYDSSGFTLRTFTSRKAAAAAAVEQYLGRAAQERSQGIDSAARADIQRVTQQADLMRDVLTGDARGNDVSGRLAIIQGYDGIVLNRSYEPDRFFNLLNRGRVLIQDNPLTYRQGQTKGAA